MPVRPQQESIECLELRKPAADDRILDALKMQNTRLKKLLDIARHETKELQVHIKKLKSENELLRSERGSITDREAAEAAFTQERSIFS